MQILASLPFLFMIFFRLGIGLGLGIWIGLALTLAVALTLTLALTLTRVHPGEPQASWMMQGLLEFLTGPSLQAKQLRDHFVFKLVPVLNPDGVVVGNQRVNLSGADLNRRWDAPSKALHPTVYAAKSMIRQLQARPNPNPPNPNPPNPTPGTPTPNP